MAIDPKEEEERVRRILAALNAEMLEGRREAVEAGDGEALLIAVLDALVAREPFPGWLGDALIAAIRRYQQHDAHSLDEAFNVKRPAGYRRGAARDRRKIGAMVVYDINQMARAGAVIDDELFEAVGNLHGVGKTTAKGYHYSGAGWPAWALPDPAEAPMERTALPPQLRELECMVKWRALPRFSKKGGITSKG